MSYSGGVIGARAALAMPAWVRLEYTPCIKPMRTV